MEQATQPKKNIKTRWIRLVAAVAAILILFSVGFWSVSAMLDDREFIEDQYTELGTSQEMGIPIPDLSRATDELFSYMKGSRDNIRISVRMNGEQVEDLFYHPKEVVHMEEVRGLWRSLVAFSIIGIALAGGCIALIVFFGRPNTRLRAMGTGIIIGASIFAGIMIAAVLWAISDFNSFWTVFHFIIFPSSLIQYLAGGLTVEAYNSLNWVFESDYAMIRMLDDLFPPLVLRAGIFFAVEIAVVLLVGIVLNRRGRKLDQAGMEIVEVRQVTQEDRFVPVDDAPDLVLQHKLQNASLRQKKKMMEELRKTPEELAEEEETRLLMEEAEQRDREAEEARSSEEAERAESDSPEAKQDSSEPLSVTPITPAAEENDPFLDALKQGKDTAIRNKLAAPLEAEDTWKKPDEAPDEETEHDLF